MKNLITITVSVLGIALAGYVVYQSLTTELLPWSNVFMASVAVVCLSLLLTKTYSSAKDALLENSKDIHQKSSDEIIEKLKKLESVFSIDEKQEKLEKLNKQIKEANNIVQQQIDFKIAAKQILDIAKNNDVMKKSDAYICLIDAYVKLKYPDYQ